MNSTWVKQYVAARTVGDATEKKAADKEARKKLIVLPIVFTIMCGIILFAMLSNPNGNTSGVPVIGVIYVVLMLMSLLLISKKKGAKTSLDFFTERVEKYVNTPDLEAALDAEMTAEPIETFKTSDGLVICFTKNFIYRKYIDDEILLAPYSAVKYKTWGKDQSDYSVDLFDGSKTFIMGLTCNQAEQAGLDALLQKYIPEIRNK